MTKQLTLNDLHIGMSVSADQLRNIFGRYMIILYKNLEDKVGTLVYNKDTQDDAEYDKWFGQTPPITCEYNAEEADGESIVYDE